MKRTSYVPLREDTSHGTRDYPCACYSASSRFFVSGGFEVKLHWHDEFEIIYCEQGRFHLEINMRSFDVSEECFFMIKNDDLHSISAQGDFSEKAFVFSPSCFCFPENDPVQKHLLKPVIEHSLLAPLQITADSPCFSELKTEFLKIVRCFDDAIDPQHFQLQYSVSDPIRFTRIKAAFYNMLAVLSEYHILDDSASIPEPDRRISLLKHALSYMKQHASETIYVGEIASHINMNEQYFCRFFKKHTGKTPVQYLNELRIRRAAELLRETDLSVMDVCLESGFSNLGNFMRVFRSRYGCTPLKYRKATDSI